MAEQSELDGPSDRHWSTEDPTVQMTRDAAGVITSVDGAVFELLAWRPDQLVGSPSTALIHPFDQPGAVAAWMGMITEPGHTGIWRGRYRTGNSTWKWVETENRYHEGDVPTVVTSMREVSPDQVSFEERFQEREQLLNQLSDALPVGVFQVDLEGHVTLTNKSFHLIVGVAPQESFEAQFNRSV